LATARFLESRLAGIGAETKLVEAGDGPPIIYGELGSGPRTLLFYNHYDVQPVTSEEWGTDPFILTERNGRLYARGVCDNKGPLLARIHAVEASQSLFKDLGLRIVFLIDGAEESGSPNLGRALSVLHEELAGVSVCLWEGAPKDPGGSPTILLGMKGICHIELAVDGAPTDLVSWWGSLVVNPAWRLMWALGTLKNSKEEITIEGLGDEVDDPSTEDAEILRTRYQFPEDAVKRALGVPEFVGNVGGEQAVQRHLFKPSVSITGIQAGYTGPGTKTILPKRAIARVDIRLVPRLTPERVVQLIRQHLDREGFSDVTLQLLSGTSPYKSRLSPMVSRVIGVADDTYASRPVISPVDPGSGPMFEVCGRTEMPVVSVGGVGDGESSVHGPNESIRWADYLETVAFVTALIRDLRGAPHPATSGST
jgi:acetylornithine deacetylase/succinyl-diaminopimelate desuccinylase-like protein